MRIISKKAPLKIIGLFFLLSPIALLLVLGIGEIVGGTISGIQHFVQALPLLFLGWLAWERPNLGGKIILGAALAFMIFYLFFPPQQFPIEYQLMNAVILSGPAIIAGVLFVISSNR